MKPQSRNQMCVFCIGGIFMIGSSAEMDVGQQIERLYVFINKYISTIWQML